MYYSVFGHTRGARRLAAWAAWPAICAALGWSPIANAIVPPPPPGCPMTTSTWPNNTPVVIPTGPAVVTSQIVVSGADPYLWDVDLTAFIQHVNCADLDVTIQSPAGTVVTLTTDNGGTFDDVFNGTTWDDDADPGNPVPYANNPGLTTDRTYVNLVVATPMVCEEALAAFVGENPNGVWTLTISDDLANNGGTLNSWRLDIAALPRAPDVVLTATFSAAPNITIPTTAPPNVFNSQIVVAGMNPAHICDVNVDLNITHTFPGDLDITLTSPAGTVITITTDNGSGSDNVFAGTLFDDDANPAGQVPYTNNNGLVSDHLYANLVVATPLVPEEALGAFIGEDPNGVWTMTVSDDASGDGGTWNTWSLTITTCACVGGKRDYLYTGRPTFLDPNEPGGFYPPLPPDFFDPGSQPFDGLIELCGAPINNPTLGNTDTIIQRPHDPIALSDPIGTVGMVPIEIIQLSLVSCEPITVTYSNGSPPQQWNVRVELSDNVPQPQGQLTAQKTHPNGGVFQGVLPVIPLLLFTQVGNPGNVRVLDTGGLLPPLQFQLPPSEWAHTAPPALEVYQDPSTVFIPGITEAGARQLIHAAALPDAAHAVCPAFQTGACCLPNGDCVLVSRSVCSELGGAFRGVLTTCVNANCRGACCFPNGSCQTLGPGTCGDLGGAYLGDGVSCNPNPCPQPPRGACCAPDGSCRIVTPEECLPPNIFLGIDVTCGEFIYPPPAVWPPGFIDIVDQANLLTLSGDDAAAAVTIPFPFVFYGNVRQSGLVSTNGYMTFGTAGTDFSNDDPIPNTLTPNDSLYALWDDLYVRADSAVYAATVGAAPNRIFVVHWQNVDLLSSPPDGSRSTFQLQVHEASNCIEFHYTTIATGHTPTIGVENATGTVATQVPFALVSPGNLRLVLCPGGQTCPQPVGACCRQPDNACVIVTRADCQRQCGEYHGDGSTCEPNPCPPRGACCFPDGHCEIRLGPVCEGLGGVFLGPDTTCDPNPCPQPGACCFPDGHCEIRFAPGCDAAGGVFVGPGTTCDPNPCPQRGACCFRDGHCEIRFEQDCVGAGGVFVGPGTTCDPNPCPQPGACCFPDGHCEIRFEQDCVGAGGVFVGPGTTCDPNPCPQPGACCFADGHCEIRFAPGCDAAGGVFLGPGTTCDPNPCPQRGACCFPDGHCEVRFEQDCHGAGGVFVGPGTTCDPNPCPQPGACCFPDGHCEIRFAPGCDAAGGVFMGPGTSCDPNPCPQPGACCFPDGHCEIRFRPVCDQLGGLFQGPGTVCVPNPCPQPGACCFPDGHCEIRLRPLCDQLGGVFQGPGTVCVPNPCPPPNPCAGYLLGDADGSLAVNNFDIDPFVLAISDPGMYIAVYCGGNPQCHICRNDLDHSNAVNNFDIDPFVECLNNLPPPGQPCP